MRRRCLAMLLAPVIAVCALAAPAAAQVWGSSDARDTVRTRPEVRLDYLGASTQAVHAGLGISVPAGTYVRAGVAAGAGPAWQNGSSMSGHVDLVARFMIDPFRQSRRGVSLGGGLSARYDERRLRGFLLLLADLEGPGRAGWIPFAAGGVGGGVRLTAGVRRAATWGR